MALVAYDSSDYSDVEDENFETVNSLDEKDELHRISNNIQEYPNISSENSLGTEKLFHNLPKPSHQQVIEEDDEFLHKNENIKREKTKINVPSLSDFKDVEDIPKKKYFQGSGKKSGLLSILPEPKFSAKATKKQSNPFIPHIVEKKIMKTDPCPPLDKVASKDNVQKPNLIIEKSILTADYSDSDEEESEHKSDFFSIHTKHEPIILSADDVNDLQTAQPRKEIEKEISADFVQKDDSSNDSMTQLSTLQTNNPGQSTHIELDDEAMRQLCGSRNKHKKEDINMITVDQTQVLSDSREWLLKGLMDDTTKRISASKRKGNEPTNQQRKKHQITYLAHQAKANEAELQNQWANNRMTKRQTQSKYGF